ncbi:membrane protein [Sediminibacter sp. Hel_I_10]|uniref:membrane protein n=1 Tax=Sediminibacter sp. Hel_I_10 TaxID=1392490 RepID=UPI00047DE575|nr:membrane protein [Sediminibacter sp. Hel_I_10]
MNSTFKISLRYGLAMTLCLIAYFLILRLFDLHENPWLRLFNGVIMSLGVYYSIKYYKLSSKTTFTYINGIKTGLISGLIATVLFTIFMAIYMFHLDVEFTQKLLGDWFEDYGVGANILIFIIFIEGMASSVVLALGFMQFFKNSNNISQKA